MAARGKEQGHAAAARAAGTHSCLLNNGEFRSKIMYTSAPGFVQGGLFCVLLCADATWLNKD